jgi:CheY-like chemotaxis protein
MEEIGRLAAGVAHDFNNLLQIMFFNSEMLLNLLPEDNSMYQFAGEIQQSAERAAALTGQLLAFSRNQILKMEELELNEVVRTMMKMFSRIIGEDIQLTFTESQQPAIINADRGQMEQVLLNLCGNARDAMPKGGTLAIETENMLIDDEYCKLQAWQTPGRYIVLKVTDTGCGMDAETQGRIFEPFFTTKETGRGTGLGLATVYGIIRQHQGMIQVYSEVDIGTTFMVYLPCVEGPAVPAGAEVAALPSGGTGTIMLAEDDAKLRKLATDILEGAGYTVLPAADGMEALAMFRKNGEKIDLALLDMIMPKMGGKAVYEALHQQYPHLRFLFSSGYCPGSVHMSFVQEEGIQLIQKPYSPNALLRKISEVLS